MVKGFVRSSLVTSLLLSFFIPLKVTNFIYGFSTTMNVNSIPFFILF